MTRLAFTVTGTPAPQGSKKGFYNPKIQRVQIVDDNKPTLRTWREDVKHAAIEALVSTGGFLPGPAGSPVRVRIFFRVPRPAYHYGTGRNAGVLKASAPTYAPKKPDLDKLIRSTCDALTSAGVYRDDAQIVSYDVAKMYADPGKPGADIAVEALDVLEQTTEPAVAVAQGRLI